jgi:hypothetical protein
MPKSTNGYEPEPVPSIACTAHLPNNHLQSYLSISSSVFKVAGFEKHHSKKQNVKNNILDTE